MASGEREVSPGGQRAAILVGACVRPTHAGMVPPWKMDMRVSVWPKTPKECFDIFTDSVFKNKTKDFRLDFSFACFKKCHRTVAAYLSLSGAADEII